MTKQQVEPGHVRAAQYLRASAEHQKYSTGNQAAAIAAYAQARGLDVVRTYVDEGVSGLSLHGRHGLQQLLADVLAGDADFSQILVYDVSRWGRFLNPDQSAHYEFLCAEAGFQISYCAEVFENDGSVASTLLKSLKRVMAAEYSRDLSVKVAQAHARGGAMGFWGGGPAPYGLRRQMVGADGRPGQVMEQGEAKALRGYKTRLVPGPPEEVATVNRIFRLYVNSRLTLRAIARLLNREGVPAGCASTWLWQRLSDLLADRRYVGDLELRKSKGSLGQVRKNLPRREWDRTPDVITPIVSRKLFDAAQRSRTDRMVFMPTEDLLKALKRLHATHGKITHQILREAPGLPAPQTIAARFGGMAGAAAAIGHPRTSVPRTHRPRLDTETLLDRLRALLAREGYLSSRLINDDPNLPRVEAVARRFGGLREAYFLAGYDDFDIAEFSSPVGRARAEAAAIRRARALGDILAGKR